jgi:hypothetical protein
MALQLAAAVVLVQLAVGSVRAVAASVVDRYRRRHGKFRPRLRMRSYWAEHAKPRRLVPRHAAGA